MFAANFTVERIQAEAEEELTGLDANLREQLWNLVYSAFKQWKQEHGDRQPRRGYGLLSDLVDNTIPFEEAEPWQCAGYITPSPTKLAIQLLRDDYTPFTQITQAVGIRLVLASLISRFSDSPQDDLFDAHSVIIRHRAMVDAGLAVMGDHKIAIVAQQSRTTGGEIRAEQQKTHKADKYERILVAEKKLSPTTKPRALNKAIAKDTELETDYVRKARKEMKKETDGS